jgi:hypothetical protein
MFTQERPIIWASLRTALAVWQKLKAAAGLEPATPGLVDRRSESNGATPPSKSKASEVPASLAFCYLAAIISIQGRQSTPYRAYRDKNFIVTINLLRFLRDIYTLIAEVMDMKKEGNLYAVGGTTNSGAGQKDKPKKTLHRSPAYPAINFNEAVNRLRVIYDYERKAITSANVIFNHLGYPGKTGPAGRVLSALRQYGLLDEADGKYKVSDVGYRILHLSDENPEKQKLIRDSALKPKLFRKLLHHFKDGLPSDATLKDHLIDAEEFNPSTVDQFIKIFRVTIDVAKLDVGGYTDGDVEDTEEINEEEGQDFMESQTSHLQRRQNTPLGSKAVAPPALKPEQRVLDVNISTDAEARVILSGKVTQEAIDLLVAVLELQKRTFPTEAQLKQPRPAIWRNKDHDQPVTVMGAAEVAPDGRRFVSVEGSDSAVPEDEIEYT